MARVTSVRLSEDLATRLERLPASLDRPKAWVIEQAIARYVEQEAWQVDAIAEALAEYRQGNASVQPHDEVMGRVETRIRQHFDDPSPLG
jgi:predicted transcriptional regulator